MPDFLIGFAAALAVAIPAAYLLTRRIITRVRSAEEKVRLGERWAELGTMAPVLVHDLKQPLSVLKINLQLLTEDIEDAAEEGDESAARCTRRIGTLQSEIVRLEGILKDFQRYAGRMNLERKPTDLNVVIEELVDFFNPQAAQHKISVRTGLSKSPVVCPVDAERLKEALLNLFINAQQAMETNGGELMIRTAASADEGQIEVCDTGPGIPAELIPRLFEASFTTKRDGSGLGLPTVRRIIELHGGRISVHSELGKGTGFTIQLPKAIPV